ncbi:MAG: tRNA (adenosine(37)-N6)-dimethylallyltransferase MiaA [Pseudonocardiales bacterium]|jgi:tRNA dimethylallyltransferase|nr:tRNA (adenosine(37)-N6)-dimethylallyltransferase MiaA [Pseudonocardiales bacterium]MBV9652300.1 tRNA (adenosine(37)-N6)-dimethylallyltransferase MiaA [Pseudonocardiales bacterium]
MNPRVIAVVGPTATGKSDLAIQLASRLGGEVVNADAMQLYRGMDIGTAKLPAAARRGVRHHLLDVLDVTETASVAVYQRDARRIVERLLTAGRVPVLAGGSGLYVRAVLDELDFPGTEPEVRAALEAELAEQGASVLHDRLHRLDPVAASRILPSNGRRLVRALEVIRITGRPFSATLPRPGPARYRAVILGLDTDPAALDARVGDRVDHMFAQGLVAEVRDLLRCGLRVGRTASRALGYQQVIDALDAGNDPAAAAGPTAAATRRFIRRQRSWFRRDDRIRWLDCQQPDLLDRALMHTRNG